MTKAKKQSWYSWYVVFISAIIGVSMTTSFPQFTMTVGEYAAKVQATEEFLLFTDTVRAVAIMIAMLISGPFYRRLGLKTTFVFSIACMVIPQILFPFLTGAPLVLVLKIVQGFSATIFPIFLLVIMDWMDQRHVGTATAIFNGIFYGGSGVGATLVGFTISEYGWKASFFMIALFTLLPAILWFATVKEKKQTDFSASEVESSSPNLPADSAEHGSTFQTVIRSFKTWALILCLFSTIWMIQILSVDLPLYGSFLQYDAKSIGLSMSSLSVGMFLACVVSGKTSDYFARKAKQPSIARLTVFAFGPLLTILSIFVMLVIDKSNFFVFYAATLLLSFSSAWGLGSFYCILPGILKKDVLEYSTGFIGGIGDIGMPVGPLVVGVLLGMKGLWTYAWVVCMVISVVSIVGALLLIKKIRPTDGR